ncbi:MAG: STAS/SEC14 domain-containing protein [Anaerolineae bacterium]|nr:STAS/SEC14 domain-containing protein [Anaerolineae bacterium]
MSKETILDTEYATLWYYPESKIMHHVFHKYIHGQEFRQVLEKGLEVFKERGGQKWLSDDRKNSALPTADMEWGLKDWNPRVWAAGWRYWAVVMPDKVAGQMNMNRLMKENIEMGLTIQVFDDADEALKWLESV